MLGLSVNLCLCYVETSFGFLSNHICNSGCYLVRDANFHLLTDGILRIAELFRSAQTRKISRLQCYRYIFCIKFIKRTDSVKFIQNTPYISKQILSHQDPRWDFSEGRFDDKILEPMKLKEKDDA